MEDSEKNSKKRKAEDMASQQQQPKVRIIHGGFPSKSVDEARMCSTYSTHIYKYLRKRETEGTRPCHDYLRTIQKGITANMREMLIDWLVDVATGFKLLPDTLYLSVSYVDRFLSENVITTDPKLQRLGITSMFIAVKYEETDEQPKASRFSYLTDDTSTTEELLMMEIDILNSLKFELGNPTAKTFLRRFNGVAQEDYKSNNDKLECLGYYLCELSLLEYTCLEFLPSIVAAAAIFLSRLTLQPDVHPWSPALQKFSGYKASDLRKCVQILHKLQLNRKENKLTNLWDKYKKQQFKGVAHIPGVKTLPDQVFEDTIES